MCTVIIKSFVCQMSWGEGWHFVLLINDSLPFLSCKVSYSFSLYSVSIPQWAYNKCEKLTDGCVKRCAIRAAWMYNMLSMHHASIRAAVPYQLTTIVINIVNNSVVLQPAVYISRNTYSTLLSFTPGVTNRFYTSL